MSKSIVPSMCLIALWLVSGETARAQSRHLDIYWVDVEGGAATLVVSPSGESLLYDAGWEVGDRDAKRIANLAETADSKGHWIRASVRQDGTFTITNSRNGFSKSYTAR